MSISRSHSPDPAALDCEEVGDFVEEHRWCAKAWFTGVVVSFAVGLLLGWLL